MSFDVLIKNVNLMLTFRESSLIHHRAPWAGELVDVEANSKLIFSVGLQISHKEALLIPVR